MGTQYAYPSDLTATGAINSVALVNVSLTDQNNVCIQASAEADQYIVVAYPLPLTGWPQILVERVCHIAAYRLMTGRGYNPLAGADDQLRLRYEDALQWLRDVSKKNIVPGFTYAAPTPPTYQLPQVYSSPPRGWCGRGTGS